MVTVQNGRVYFNSFLAGQFFFSEIDRGGVSLSEGEPTVGGDHEVVGADDLGVDDEFGFEEAGVVVDRGVFGSCGRDGYSAAPVPGLDDEDGVVGADGAVVMENDRVGDAFGDDFIRSEGVLGGVPSGAGWVGEGVGGRSRAQERVKQQGEGKEGEGPQPADAGFGRCGGICRCRSGRGRGVRGVALPEVIPVFEAGEAGQRVEGMDGWEIGVSNFSEEAFEG